MTLGLKSFGGSFMRSIDAKGEAERLWWKRHGPQTESAGQGQKRLHRPPAQKRLHLPPTRERQVGRLTPAQFLHWLACGGPEHARAKANGASILHRAKLLGTVTQLLAHSGLFGSVDMRSAPGRLTFEKRTFKTNANNRPLGAVRIARSDVFSVMNGPGRAKNS